MNLIARLKETRPSLSVAELAAASTVEARFEGFDELRDAARGGELRRVRVYTVGGHLFERDVIVIPADLSVGVADAMAQQGLQDTINDLRDTLVPPDERVMPSVEAIPTYSEGMSPRMRVMIERIYADRYGRQAWPH